MFSWGRFVVATRRILLLGAEAVGISIDNSCLHNQMTTLGVK